LEDLPDSLLFTSEPHTIVNSLLEKFDPDQVVFLVDENTRHHCLPHLPYDYPIIEIESGEAHKNLNTCGHIWQEMTALGLSRKSLLINLGGGVIGDMGGFVAATYKRGIRFVNVPTTLLSMVDASIGGKLGVDFEGLKNHIGLFQSPYAVVIAPIFLKTLPADHLRSGFAEVLKHGLIRDALYWQKVSRLGLSETDWLPIIKHSVSIKNQVVQADPSEKGLRKILNFGHSLGHAIESHFLRTQTPLLHGEAIAVGMLLEAFISNTKGYLALDELERIGETIKRYFPLPELPEYYVLLPWLKQDKKNTGDAINIVVLDAIGMARYDERVEEKEIMEALTFYGQIR
jgi:3-dehydroquinate synthase